MFEFLLFLCFFSCFFSWFFLWFFFCFLGYQGGSLLLVLRFLYCQGLLVLFYCQVLALFSCQGLGVGLRVGCQGSVCSILNMLSSSLKVKLETLEPARVVLAMLEVSWLFSLVQTNSFIMSTMLSTSSILQFSFLQMSRSQRRRWMARRDLLMILKRFSLSPKSLGTSPNFLCSRSLSLTMRRAARMMEQKRSLISLAVKQPACSGNCSSNLSLMQPKFWLSRQARISTFSKSQFQMLLSLVLTVSWRKDSSLIAIFLFLRMAQSRCWILALAASCSDLYNLVTCCTRARLIPGSRQVSRTKFRKDSLKSTSNSTAKCCSMFWIYLYSILVSGTSTTPNSLLMNSSSLRQVCTRMVSIVTRHFISSSWVWCSGVVTGTSLFWRVSCLFLSSSWMYLWATSARQRKSAFSFSLANLSGGSSLRGKSLGNCCLCSQSRMALMFCWIFWRGQLRSQMGGIFSILVEVGNCQTGLAFSLLAEQLVTMVSVSLRRFSYSPESLSEYSSRQWGWAQRSMHSWRVGLRFLAAGIVVCLRPTLCL